MPLNTQTTAFFPANNRIELTHSLAYVLKPNCGFNNLNPEFFRNFIKQKTCSDSFYD